MADERPRRPELHRRDPRRSFAHGDDGIDDGFPRGPGDSEDGEGGFIEEGVRAAYAVLDTYLREGRRVARKLGRFPLPPLLPGRDSRERHARFMELTGELAANWFDLVGLVSESLADFWEWEDTSGIRVFYDVESARPTAVRVEFLRGKATTRVTTDGLRARDRAVEPIPVTFEAPDEQSLVVRIRVPAERPAGLYSAVLLNAEDGQIAGALSLEVR